MFWKRKRIDTAPAVACTWETIDQLKKIVEALPRQKCLEIYESLKVAQWHEALGTEPEGWGYMTTGDRRFILGDAVRHIEDRIPLKERKRYERQKKYGETEEQFNEWWESIIVENILWIRKII